MYVCKYVCRHILRMFAFMHLDFEEYISISNVCNYACMYTVCMSYNSLVQLQKVLFNSNIYTYMFECLLFSIRILTVY